MRFRGFGIRAFSHALVGHFGCSARAGDLRARPGTVVATMLRLCFLLAPWIFRSAARKLKQKQPEMS